MHSTTFHSPRYSEKSGQDLLFSKRRELSSSDFTLGDTEAQLVSGIGSHPVHGPSSVLFDSLVFACFELVPEYFAKPYTHHDGRYHGEMARCQRFDPVAITGKF